MKLTSALLAALLTFAAIPAHADIAAIHENELPQTPSVLSAFDDAHQLEPYTDHWSPTWNYPIPKQTAANRLALDFTVLKAAVKKDPHNEELLLLTALVAHYAYNVDVPGTFKVLRKSLIEAAKLEPADVRPNWFDADFLCQTTTPDVGARTFLAIENAHPWRDLPAGFWDNYLACALITNMPAHALRAADHLAAIKAPPNQMRAVYIKVAHERLDRFDPQKSYDSQQTAYLTPAGSDSDVVSTPCGLKFRVKPNWKFDRLEIDHGVCAVVLSMGPYKAPTGPLSPEIVIVIRQAQNNETLPDFLHKFTQKGTFKPTNAPYCPADACLAMSGVEPPGYGKDGESHPRFVVFERDQPQYPGLIFESPQGPPASFSKPGPHDLRPDHTLERIPGKLYYLIGLDTASSIEPQAKKDFAFFLQHVVVE